MNKNFKTILKNPMYFLWFIKRTIACKFWSLINISSANLWGIKIGKNCKFRGKADFLREPGSQIRIGNNCSFYNSTLTNRVGLYCPCMFSTIEEKATLSIGNNCGFSGTRIWTAKKITIGNNVRCGANTYITDSDAHTDDYRAGKNAEVIIEDNVWLGMDVKVLKGVHIGKNSMIAAGSIVTKSIPENVIAGGIPCKIIKEIKI